MTAATTDRGLISAPAETPRGLLGRALRIWASLDTPVLGRRVPGTGFVMLVSALLMTGVSIYTVQHGAAMWYSDALSHLTIARRIFDNKAPGFQQLGTVWLPVPHLMLVPFVADLTMWRTGWSAALLGIFCLAGTSAAMYRTAARLGLRRTGRLLTLLVLWTNVSFLYAHTTALTEPVLFLTMSGCVAGMTHWATARRPLSGGELAVYAGVPGAGAVLSRYEGWVLVMSMSLFIVIVEWRRSRSQYPSTYRLLRFIVLRRLLPAVLPPIIAIGWWLAYNYAIYRDPLEFMFGQYSAYAQQKSISTYGTLTTKGNLGVSLFVYNWSMVQTLGVVAIVIGTLGFLLVVATRGLDTVTLVLGVLFATYVFEVAALYLGMSVMNNSHSLPQGLFNVRYGIQPILFCALGTGFAVELLRRWTRRFLPAILIPYVAVFALAAQAGWWLEDPVAHNSLIGEGAYNNATRPDAAAEYLRQHYRGGGILMDESGASNGIIPLVGVRISEYWNRSTGDHFATALASPASHARWLFVNTSSTGGMNLDGMDAVYADMIEHPELFTAYTRVFVDGEHAVYERAW